MPLPVRYLLNPYSFLALALFIGGILLWRHLHSEQSLQKYLYQRTQQLFFCGYSFQYISQQNLLHNLERYLEADLSEVYAILMMMVLKGKRSARLVRFWSREGGQGHWHSWVEFRWYGTWYSLDPSWHECQGASMSKLNRKDQFDDNQFCTYKWFWSQPAFQQTYLKLQSIETSFLFAELLDITRTAQPDAEVITDDSGRYFRQVSFDHSKFVTAKIVNDMITRRDYRGPSLELIIDAMKEKDRTHHR